MKKFLMMWAILTMSFVSLAAAVAPPVTWTTVETAVGAAALVAMAILAST